MKKITKILSLAVVTLLTACGDLPQIDEAAAKQRAQQITQSQVSLDFSKIKVELKSSLGVSATDPEGGSVSEDAIQNFTFQMDADKKYVALDADISFKSAEGDQKEETTAKGSLWLYDDGTNYILAINATVDGEAKKVKADLTAALIPFETMSQTFSINFIDYITGDEYLDEDGGFPTKDSLKDQLDKVEDSDINIYYGSNGEGSLQLKYNVNVDYTLGDGDDAVVTKGTVSFNTIYDKNIVKSMESKMDATLTSGGATSTENMAVTCNVSNECNVSYPSLDGYTDMGLDDISDLISIFLA